MWDRQELMTDTWNKCMAFSHTKMLLYTQIVGNKQQVFTSIHKIYPYKLYKCINLDNSVELHYLFTNIWQNDC